MSTSPEDQTPQTKLLYDVLDALGELVRALEGPKKVGPMLRPELPAEQAAQWVRDCLNANRREKFDPAQVMLLLKWGRARGYHTAMQFIAEDAGYSRPTPIDPQDEQARLVATIRHASEVLKTATERLEKVAALPQTSPVRAVK